jgi:predicted O-methyltransferase YrrM
MARFVAAGNTILNVGTHIGIESVVLGKGLGKNGRLFMF